MSTNFTLPELGENIESGTVTAVLVAVGDSVESEQPVIELETDKAVVEVPCPNGGVISEILAREGEKINVGDVVLVLNGAADAGGSSDPVAEIEETDTAAEQPSTKDEPEEEPAAQEALATPVAVPTPPVAPAQQEENLQTKKMVRAAPSVRKLAREIGVDISSVQPAAPGMRITSDDVKLHAKQQLAGAGSVASTDLPRFKLPDFEKYGTVRREEMSQVRKMTLTSMTRSWTTIPHVTQHDSADITEMEKFRKQYGKQVQAAGAKLTATAILVRVLAEALKRFPQFNSSIDPDKHEIIFKEYYHIGVAVDTPAGLLVPNIKDADTKNLTEISLELTGLSERARERKTKLDELQGTCMTITNLGGIGGTSFTPIVNSPEVAILGVSRATMEPVFVDGEFQPRMMMPISLSYDHRIVDGADAARFARWICNVLEQPLTMFLN